MLPAQWQAPALTPAPPPAPDEVAIKRLYWQRKAEARSRQSARRLGRYLSLASTGPLALAMQWTDGAWRTVRRFNRWPDPIPRE